MEYHLIWWTGRPLKNRILTVRRLFSLLRMAVSGGGADERGDNWNGW